jgi:ABC-2 type transport system ATP-binding protein
MITPVLHVQHVQKRYGDLVAVNDVSFDVPRGQCFGLLGPNGAGKTTTISMACGILRPDGGRVEIAGESVTSDTSPAKRRIGYVPQELALYEELSATDNLRLFGSMYGLRGAALRVRIDQALQLTGLSDRATEPVSRYSGGMKRRLNIGAAILHEPELLVFDEPTVGVDPQSRNAIFETLKSLQAAGKTIVYTTHYMEEVERLCDRVAIMDHGVIVADDTLAGLQKLLPASDELEVEVAPVAEGDGQWVAQLPATVAGVRQANLRGQTLTADIEQLGRDAPAVLAFLRDRGVEVRAVTTRRASLEDVFLHLTGRTLRD